MIKIAAGVVIDDISDWLLHHPSRKYKERTKPINTLFVHHTGVDNGRNGLQSWAATAGYHVITRGWPGIAYHYGITVRPSITKSGELVIHQLQPETTICYHTKGCNSRGVGLVLQGNHGREPLSDFQIECLEAFIPWWHERHGLEIPKALGWHSASWRYGGVPKPACPGKYAVKWLKTYKKKGGENGK